MSDALGLSIGTTNLVAAGVGRQPVLRRSVVTVYGHAAPEVGTPAGRAGGVVLSGFVERVGDPVPLVAADGSAYPAEQLVVEALESMAGLAVDLPPAEVAIAVPAHWGPAAIGALQRMLTVSDVLSPGGATPRLVPDAVAALTAVNADPGLDRRGVIALLDVGGSGTSVTLADAASAFDVIGGTERSAEFAGDQIDQALLTHVLGRVGGDRRRRSGPDRRGRFPGRAARGMPHRQGTALRRHRDGRPRRRAGVSGRHRRHPRRTR